MTSKEQEIRVYLETNVDPYLKPLLLDLMKSQPGNVQEYMKEWLSNKGQSIYDDLNKDAPQKLRQSVHYDAMKKSLVNNEEVVPVEGKEEAKEEEPAPVEEIKEVAPVEGEEEKKVDVVVEAEEKKVEDPQGEEKSEEVAPLVEDKKEEDVPAPVVEDKKEEAPVPKKE